MGLPECRTRTETNENLAPSLVGLVQDTLYELTGATDTEGSHAGHILQAGAAKALSFDQRDGKPSPETGAWRRKLAPRSEGASSAMTCAFAWVTSPYEAYEADEAHLACTSKKPWF